ncbi:unnamed protein product, partial [Ectocarpus fasciculatus]
LQGRILGDDLTVAAAGLQDGHAVHVVKVAAPTAAPSTAAPIASQPAPVAELTREFDQAMEKLLTNAEAVVQNAVGLLLKILNNIVSHPMEEKYRKIKSSNAAFASKVHTTPGGAECMRGAGFAEESGEWVLRPSPRGWDQLVACRNKLQVFSDKLSQRRAPLARPAPAASAPGSPPVDPSAVLAILAALQAAPPGGPS